MSFNIGDRVRVYHFTDAVSGTIKRPPEYWKGSQGHLFVEFDRKFHLGNEKYIQNAFVHPKQCRKLVSAADKFVIMTTWGEYFCAPGEGVTSNLEEAHIYTKEQATTCTWKTEGDQVVSLKEARQRAKKS